MSMSPRMKKFAAATMMVCLVTVPVSASAKDFLQSMFDDMWTATTDPAFVQTQTRGGLVGGSFTARIPTKPISVFAVDPPRLSAGCGGIDLYAGSFSFINSDQLIAILRTIGQQAKALLFKLAIDAINKQMSGMITEFAEKIQKMNEMLKNTCAIAQGAVDLATPDAWKEGADNKGRSFSDKLNTATGKFTDGFNGMVNSFSNWNWNKDMKQNPEIAKGNDPTMFNMVWRQAFVSKGLQELAQGTNSGDNLGVTAVLLMNITGTSIMRPEDSANPSAACKDSSGNAIPNCSQQAQVVSKRITIDMLKNPKDDLISVCADEAIPSGDKSAWLKSVDPVQGCLSMTDTKLSNLYPGTDRYINKVMYGVDKSEMADTDYQNVNGGLVGYITKGTALDSQTKAMLASTDIPTLGFLRKVQRDRGAVLYVAKEILPILSEDMAVGMMRAFAKGGRGIFNEGGTRVITPGNFYENIALAEAEVTARSMKSSERVAAIAKLDDYVSKIVANLPTGANIYGLAH